MNIYYEAILQASEYIEENLTQDIKVQDIIQNVGFSQYHFMRLFKAISGHTISNYIKRRKMTEASKLLLTTDMRILDIPVNADLFYKELNKRIKSSTYKKEAEDVILDVSGTH
jgi:AraC family transcriptional regulator